MSRSLILFLSKGYLKHRKGDAFLSFMSVLSILGVIIGVMVLIIVTSVMNGFERELKSKMLGTLAPLMIYDSFGDHLTDYEPLEVMLGDIDYVTSWAPSIEGFGLIQARHGNTGIFIRGIDLEKEPQVTDVLDSVIDGRAPENENEIMVGEIMARQYGLFPGEEAIIVTRVIQTATGYRPKFGRAQVVGLFRTGLYSYDSNYAFISLEFARDLFVLPEGGIDNMKVYIPDPYHAPRYAKQLQKDLGAGYYVQSWHEVNQELFAAIQLEKRVMFLILSLIILVGAFNIISSQYMIVKQKTKEIGILNAMGMTSREISSIFIYQGILIGSLGSLIGTVAGISACILVDRYQLIPLPGYVYDLSSLPMAISIPGVVIINLLAFSISVLATLYPAYRASKLHPVECLKYE